jgi:hypothetical protein
LQADDSGCGFVVVFDDPVKVIDDAFDVVIQEAQRALVSELVLAWR